MQIIQKKQIFKIMQENANYTTCRFPLQSPTLYPWGIWNQKPVNHSVNPPRGWVKQWYGMVATNRKYFPAAPEWPCFWKKDLTADTPDSSQYPKGQDANTEHKHKPAATRRRSHVHATGHTKHAPPEHSKCNVFVDWVAHRPGRGQGDSCSSSVPPQWIGPHHPQLRSLPRRWARVKGCLAENKN